MIVLIPAYEPTEKLVDLVKKIKSTTTYSVIIVDDGSGEKYSNIFNFVRAQDVCVLEHSKNLGKGAAIKTGLKYLVNNNITDNVVCADCDGQHKVEDIQKVGNKIKNNKNEIVLGVRNFKGKIPLRSFLGNRFSSLFLYILTSIKLNDTQTGLRGFPNSLLSWLLLIDGQRFDYEFNMLFRCKDDNIQILQVPIDTIYDDNNKGTHFRMFRDSLIIYMTVVKYLASSVFSGIIDFVLLLLMYHITDSLLISVVFARCISSVVNFYINKNMVFKTKKISKIYSASKYFSLVVVIMILNYILMYTLTKIVYIPIVFAKIIVELLLFILNYIIQRRYIFKENLKNIVKY